MNAYIELLRPLQWVKNLFVFAPIFFSGNMLTWEYWTPTLMVFVSFCLVSSSIYCFNDIHDLEADRLHPKKCKRPIASGRISVGSGYVMMAVCALASLVILCFTESKNLPYLYGIIIGYWLMNIAYCLRLKQYAVVDVTIISIGFVLRVLVGGMTTDIWISQWLVLMTFLLSLFLALAKRNSDFHIFARTGTKPRVSITGYNETFISVATAIVASVTLVCYIMYTMTEDVINRMGTKYVYLTSGWVLLGLLRYLQKMMVYDEGDSPTKALTSDRFVQFCVIGWLISFVFILYL